MLSKLTSTFDRVVFALEGRKTYIIATTTAVLNIAVAFNMINPAHLAQINAVLVALGGMAIRAGINKV